MLSASFSGGADLQIFCRIDSPVIYVACLYNGEIWSAALSSSSLSSSSYHHIVSHRQHRQQHLKLRVAKQTKPASTHTSQDHIYTRGPSPRLLLIGRTGRQTQHMNCYFFYLFYFPALIFDLHISNGVAFTLLAPSSLVACV
jgi:hypothetical protein